MISIGKFILVLLGLTLALPCFGAETITLKAPEELNRATEISTAFRAVSNKVMECVRNNNGVKEGCLCQTYEECPFKEEHGEFLKKLCAGVKDYPEWKSNNVYFRNETNGTNESFATANLYRYFGKYCK